MSALGLRCANKLLEFTNVFLTKRNLSNKTAIFTKIKRSFFFRHYPVKIVLSDGSSYTIRYFEPRKIIKLPIDLSILTEEEKQEVLKKRKKKEKIIIKEEDYSDSFSSKEYLKKMKRV